MDDLPPEKKRRRKIPPRVLEDPEFINDPAARPLRILGEYIHPGKTFRDEHITDTVVFFGSARIYPSPKYRRPGDLSGQDYGQHSGLNSLSHYYSAAMHLSEGITRWSLEQAESIGRRVLICTGGGPGIMEAANRGANEAGGQSIGLNIVLPHEQNANPYVSPHLNFNFQYFFMRKYWFLYYTRALVAFPGGFGTMDELFETLTLRQTGIIEKNFPILLFGKDFWKNAVNFQYFADLGLITQADLDLFTIVDDVPHALALITESLKQVTRE